MMSAVEAVDLTTKLLRNPQTQKDVSRQLSRCCMWESNTKTVPLCGEKANNTHADVSPNFFASRKRSSSPIKSVKSIHPSLTALMTCQAWPTWTMLAFCGIQLFATRMSSSTPTQVSSASPSTRTRGSPSTPSVPWRFTLASAGWSTLCFNLIIVSYNIFWCQDSSIHITY